MLNMILHIFTCTNIFGLLFMDPYPDFSGSNPDVWPIRIRTEGKKSDLSTFSGSLVLLVPSESGSNPPDPQSC